MNKKRDYTDALLGLTLSSIFLILIYFCVTAYIPLIDIIEIQYIFDPKSNFEIGVEDPLLNYKVTDIDEKMKIYNMFSSLKLRKDIFLAKPELKRKVYYVKLKHKKNDGTEIEYKINIFENGMIEINNQIFDSSKNIYNEINHMVFQGGNT